MILDKYYHLSFNFSFAYDWFTLLSPKSDQYSISPYNITPELLSKAMRVKEMINKLRSSWLLNKFSLSAP